MKGKNRISCFLKWYVLTDILTQMKKSPETLEVLLKELTKR